MDAISVAAQKAVVEEEDKDTKEMKDD